LAAITAVAAASLPQLLLLLLPALTSLYHEALDVSMKDDSIVVVAGTQC
jgi:hypothetical protein